MNRLELLGSVRCLCDGEIVRGFESRKALALLCYLATRTQPISRAEIANLFWGDKTETQGRGNLSRVLHNLSSLFPKTLATDREWVGLVPHAFTLDSAEFEALRLQGDPRALGDALNLYRGEFMSGLNLDDCPEFEIWLVQERERWRQRVVAILEGLLRHQTKQGEYVTALGFAARLLDLEPWHEETHREMMRLLAQTGQRSAALQQYETARRVLREELNVEPSAETTALYAKIRSEEISPRIVPPHNLPTQLTSFIGRETEITRITARLNNPECRLLTLVGTGGIGKTRLALEAAKNILNSFHDGIYFVSLASIGAGQTEFIVPALANALGITFKGTEEPKTQLLNFLRAKQMLLVLDNFEHLLDGVNLVIEILQRAPNVKILATSREPLNVQAEWVTRVEGLNYPNTVPQNESALAHYSALQLFVERAGRVDANFVLSPDVRAFIVQICQRIEGLPLGIELAAAATRFHTLKKIADQIAHNLDAFAMPAHDIEARHTSLRAVLDWSYATLSPLEQKLFRRLGVFAGGWTREAAEQVCAGEGIEPNQVFGLLSQLVAASLVIQQEQAAEMQYHFLEPIHEYALANLLVSGEQDQIRLRHAQYYLKLAELGLDSRHSLRTWLEQIDAVIDNVRAAIVWTRSDEKYVDMLLQFATAMESYCYHRGNWIEGKIWLESAMGGIERVKDLPTKADAFRRFAELHAPLGEYSVAKDNFNISMGYFQELGDRPMQAWILNRLGWLEREFDYGSAARVRLEESLALYQELGESNGIAWASITLGEVFVLMEDAEAALELIEKALVLFRKPEDPYGTAWALNHLGHVYQLKGEFAKARSKHKESLAMFREFAVTLNYAWAHQGLGEAALGEGDAPLAAFHFTKGLGFFPDMAYRSGIAWCLAGLGGASALEQKFERAAFLWGVAKELRSSIHARPAPAARATHEHLMRDARANLGETRFANARYKGELAPVEQVVADILRQAASLEQERTL